MEAKYGNRFKQRLWEFRSPFLVRDPDGVGLSGFPHANVMMYIINVMSTISGITMARKQNSNVI